MNTQKQIARNFIVALILVITLIGFEIFNFDTTRYALLDWMGGLKFLGIEWATILAFAFSGIDFAGLVRLFTPEQGRNEPREVWFLTGAWLLGAVMNAILTGYTVMLAIAPRTSVAAGVIAYGDMLTYAPPFIALLVWLTRLLFIGSISIAAERLVGKPGQVQTTPSRSARHPNGRSEQTTLPLEER
jgi:hypothetical protein